MKDSIRLFSALIISFSFFLTGCYTQFQSMDRFPVDDKYKDYNAWDNFERYEDDHLNDQTTSSEYDTYQEGITEDEYVETQEWMDQNEVYYKDQDTENWYKDNYIESDFWRGYRTGYNDGFDDGFDQAYYHQPTYHHYPYYSYRYSYYSPWSTGHYITIRPWYTDRYYGYYDPFYDPYFNAGLGFGYGFGFYGGWYSHQYNVFSVHYAYVNTVKRTNYSRNADLYVKGPRNGNLANRSDNRRTRSGLYRNNENARNSEVRSRSGVRVRSNDTGRSRSKDIERGRTNNTGRGRSVENRTKRKNTNDTGRSRSNVSGKKVDDNRKVIKRYNLSDRKRVTRRSVDIERKRSESNSRYIINNGSDRKRSYSRVTIPNRISTDQARYRAFHRKILKSVPDRSGNFLRKFYDRNRSKISRDPVRINSNSKNIHRNRSKSVKRSTPKRSEVKKSRSSSKSRSSGSKRSSGKRSRS